MGLGSGLLWVLPTLLVGCQECGFLGGLEAILYGSGRRSSGCECKILRIWDEQGLMFARVRIGVPTTSTRPGMLCGAVTVQKIYSNVHGHGKRRGGCLLFGFEPNCRLSVSGFNQHGTG